MPTYCQKITTNDIHINQQPTLSTYMLSCWNVKNYNYNFIIYHILQTSALSHMATSTERSRLFIAKDFKSFFGLAICYPSSCSHFQPQAAPQQLAKTATCSHLAATCSGSHLANTCSGSHFAATCCNLEETSKIYKITFFSR